MIPKFRAFDIETKTIRDVLTINFETSNVVVDMGYADIDETTRWNALLKKGDYVLMQSTGMRDVNGVEIYEGDIIRYRHEEGSEWRTDSVKWFGYVGYPAFDCVNMQSQENSLSLLLYSGVHIVEVIGNIYENAELLEEGY